MSSKRQRGESSKSSSYDKKKFVSEDAADRFHKVLVNKTLVPERGLRPHETRSGEMAAMILERGWQNFTQQPEAAVISVVKEFYAKAKEAQDYVVKVRGKLVPFDKNSINSYYQLQDIQDDDYTEYEHAHEELDLDTVIRTLCRPGAEWKSRGNDEAINFPNAELSKYGKAWYSFICAKLMPTTHVSDVIKDRAVLLYAIVKGKSIDVGQVILDSISHTIKGSTSGGLPHPSLICGLCQRARVKWDEDEIRQPPMALIDHGTISRYKVWEGGSSHPRGAGFIINEPLIIEGPSEPQRIASTSSSSCHRTLTEEVHGLKRELQRQNRRIDQVIQRLDKFMAYLVDFNSALAQMFTKCGFNCGPNQVQFPNPPVFPTAHPDEAEDDDN